MTYHPFIQKIYYLRQILSKQKQNSNKTPFKTKISKPISLWITSSSRKRFCFYRRDSRNAINEFSDRKSNLKPFEMEGALQPFLLSSIMGKKKRERENDLKTIIITPEIYGSILFVHLTKTFFQEIFWEKVLSRVFR